MEPKVEIIEGAVERRYYKGAETRAAEDDSKPVIEGQGAVFNEYANLGYFVEIIEPGFFDDVLEGDTCGLWNHNDDIPLGRTTNKTLELSQTDKALEYRIHVNPDDAEAMSKFAKVKRGDVKGSSFAWITKSMARGDEMDGDEWYVMGDKIVRRLKKGGCAELLDVSPVTYPAYPTTTAAVRSKAQEMQEKPPVQTDQAAPDGAEEPAADGMAVRQAARRRRLELAELGK